MTIPRPRADRVPLRLGLAGLAAAAAVVAAAPAAAEDARSWMSRGGEALRAGRFAEAASAYTQAEAAATTDAGRAGAANSLGFALFKARRYDEATAALTRAVTLEPAHKSAWATLGAVALRAYEAGLSGTAALDAAAADLTKAAEVNPATRPDTMQEVQDALARERAWAAAVAARAGQPARAPAPTGTWSSYRAAGEAAEREADFDLAAADYARAEAVATSPRTKGAAANFSGLLALLRRRPLEALGHLRRATALDPASPYAWNNLGVAALRAYDAGAGDKPLVEEAVAAFAKVRDLNAAYKPENLAWAAAILAELGGPSATVAADGAPSTTAAASPR